MERDANLVELITHDIIAFHQLLGCRHFSRRYNKESPTYLSETIESPLSRPSCLLHIWFIRKLSTPRETMARSNWLKSKQQAASSLQSLFSTPCYLRLDPAVCSTRLRFVNDDRLPTATSHPSLRPQFNGNSRSSILSLALVSFPRLFADLFKRDRSHASWKQLCRRDYCSQLFHDPSTQTENRRNIGNITRFIDW